MRLAKNVIATTAVLAATLAPAADAAAPKLSTRDAARAIVEQARSDGRTGVSVKECRRLNRRRVVCSIVAGDGALDRYVAGRRRSGRIGVAHRPILPPAVGH